MQGQYDDGDTGLYYNTFRYYDADSGRFAAEDPIGLAGGDNLYQYAPNPISWADPLGWSGLETASGVPLPDAAFPLVVPLGGAAAGGGGEILGGLVAGACLGAWWNLPPHERLRLLMPIPWWIVEMPAAPTKNPHVGKVAERVKEYFGNGPKCDELKRLRQEHKENISGRHETKDEKAYVKALEYHEKHLGCRNSGKARGGPVK